MRTLEPLDVSVFMTLMAATLPFALGFVSDYISIAAATWLLNLSPRGYNLHLLLQFFPLLQFTFLRFVFALQMTRLYQGKSSVRTAIYVGVISECPFLVISIINALPSLWNPAYPYGFSGIPLPFVLLVGWLLIKRYPPPVRRKTWIKDEKTETWWESRN
ncbi:MAG: hypothetical protein ACFFFC_20485 [Candidatus Thorarchaeota archaeon]